MGSEPMLTPRGKSPPGRIKPTMQKWEWKSQKAKSEGSPVGPQKAPGGVRGQSPVELKALSTSKV